MYLIYLLFYNYFKEITVILDSYNTYDLTMGILI